MTIWQKKQTLMNYCDSHTACKDCELKDKYDEEVDVYTDNYECSFYDMSYEMVDKIYNWYKELDPAACENAEVKYSKNTQESTTLSTTIKLCAHKDICKKLNDIYKAKNHDYGDSFGNTYKKLGIISAVTRLSDKMNRLMSLAVKHDAQVKDEKIEDTLLDMANYAIMTLIELGYEPEN